MTEVTNWQLGREMEYPFEGERPQKQFAMIMDTNKCLGCQTCTINCKQTWTWGRGSEYVLWNQIESKPYGSYPNGWDVTILGMMGSQEWEGTTYKGETVFDLTPGGERVLGYLPDEIDWAHPNLGEDEPTGEIERGTHIPSTPHEQMWMFYLQRICNHCSHPACAAGCPRKAIYKRPEDGIVLVDQERCRGYQECVRACPYKKTQYNNQTRVTEKCIACYPKIEDGEQNQCVTGCIGRIRLAGFVSQPDKANSANPIDFLIHDRKIALPLYPQFGTEPNVYYIPPLNAPEGFLRQTFGPGAENARTAYKKARAGDDPQLQGLLMLFGATEKLISTFNVEGGTARGFDEKGAEFVSVPITEPTIIRDYLDEERDVFRHNIT